MNINPVFLTDSYKPSHYNMMVPGITEMYSVLIPRNNKYLVSESNPRVIPEYSKDVVVFGIQYLLEDLKHKWDTGFFSRQWEEVETEILFVLSPHIHFSKQDVERFKKLYNLGYLPLEIKALPEGTISTLGIPVLTIKNTHPDFYWLPNYLESYILNTMTKPLTVATIVRNLAKVRNDAFAKTSVESVAFALHDFSYRGHHGSETAAVAGMAFSLFSGGTDNIPALIAANQYYNAKSITGYSIAATEHAVTSSGILMFKDILKEASTTSSVTLAKKYEMSLHTFETAINKCKELEANLLSKQVIRSKIDKLIGETFNLVRLLMDKHPTGILAYVSDTFYYWSVVNEILPVLKDIIISRDGKLVIRPDSADPFEVLFGTLNSNNFTEVEEIDEDVVKDILLEQLKNETPHGECGNDSYEGIFKCKGKYYQGWISNVEWNRYDKQYYYIDSIYNIKTSFKEIEPTYEQTGTFASLVDIFGTTTNRKGYKVLDSHIGVVYGDGMTLSRIQSIYAELDNRQLAADNICLAAGAYLLSHVSRDDLGLAIKASNISLANGTDIPVYKDPETDVGKRSPCGLLSVLKVNNSLTLISNATKEQEEKSELKTVFLNGTLINPTSFEEIQSKLNVSF